MDLEQKPSIHTTRIYTVKSYRSAEDTYNRLVNILHEKKIPIRASFDFSKWAQEEGEFIRFSRVIFFGTAERGRKLIQKNQLFGLCLPCRILVWEDENRDVFLSFVNLDNLAGSLGIEEAGIVRSLQKNMENFVNRACGKPRPKVF